MEGPPRELKCNKWLSVLTIEGSPGNLGGTNIPPVAVIVRSQRSALRPSTTAHGFMSDVHSLSPDTNQALIRSEQSVLRTR